MVPEMMMLIGLIMLVFGIHRALTYRPRPVPEMPRPPMSPELEADLMRPVEEWISEAEAVAIREWEFAHRVDLSHLYT